MTKCKVWRIMGLGKSPNNFVGIEVDNYDKNVRKLLLLLYLSMLSPQVYVNKCSILTAMYFASSFFALILSF